MFRTILVAILSLVVATTASAQEIVMPDTFKTRDIPKRAPDGLDSISKCDTGIPVRLWERNTIIYHLKSAAICAA